MSAEQKSSKDGPRVLTSRFRPQPPRIESRDFRVPPRPYRRIVQELETLSDALGLRLRNTLGNGLQLRVDVAPQPLQFPSYGSALGGFTEECWTQPISTASGDRGLVIFDHALQESLIAHFLGTKPKDEDADGEDGVAPMGEDEASAADGDESGDGGPVTFRFGFLSRAVLKPTMSSALRELNAQLAFGRDRAFAIDEIAGKLGLRGLLPAGDACVVLGYDIHTESVSGSISVLVPLRPLQALVKRDRQTVVRRADARARRALESVVRGIDVPLTTRVGRAEIDVQEYLKLAVGDVLVLDQSLTQPLEVAVGGRAMFLGRPGRSGGRLAVRLVTTLDRN